MQRGIHVAEKGNALGDTSSPSKGIHSTELERTTASNCDLNSCRKASTAANTTKGGKHSGSSDIQCAHIILAVTKIQHAATSDIDGTAAQAAHAGAVGGSSHIHLQGGAIGRGDIGCGVCIHNKGGTGLHLQGDRTPIINLGSVQIPCLAILRVIIHLQTRTVTSE